MKTIRVIVACEESQAVCKAFRERGFEAFSCDIEPCSGGHPEWHFQEDIFTVLMREPRFDLMIAHPPCTYLAVSGARWLYHPEDSHLPIEERREHPHHIGRREMQKQGIEFFMKLTQTSIRHWAIENPVGCMSSEYRKPDQIIQPFWFGESASKKTCLWLRDLPLLKPTNIVDQGPRVVLSSGRSLPKWYSDSFNTRISAHERRRLRSKTFEGIAKAMAEQWGNYLKGEI